MTSENQESVAQPTPMEASVSTPKNIIQISPLIGQGAIVALCEDSTIWLGSLLVPRQPESQITWVRIWKEP